MEFPDDRRENELGPQKLLPSLRGKELCRLNRARARDVTGLYQDDGTRLVSSGRKTIKVWDLETGKERFSLTGVYHDR